MMKPIVVQEVVDTTVSSSEASALRRRIASLEKRNMRLEEEKWFRRETSTATTTPSTTPRYRGDDTVVIVDDDEEDIFLEDAQDTRKKGPMSQATAEQIQWVAELIHGSAARAESLCSSTAVSSVSSSEVRVSISPAQSCTSMPASRSASPAAVGSCQLQGLLPPSLQKEEDDDYDDDVTHSETSQPTPIPIPTISVLGPSSYPPYLPSDFSPVSAVTSASSTTPVDDDEEDDCQSDEGCIVPLIPTTMMLPPVPLAPRTPGKKHRLDRFMPLRVVREEGTSLMTPVMPGGVLLNTSVERSPSMVGGSPSNASIHEFSTSHRRPNLHEEGEDSSGGFPSDVFRPYAVRPDFRLSPFENPDIMGTYTAPSPPHASSLSSSLTEKTLSCMTPIISSADPSDDYTSPVASHVVALPQTAPLLWGCGVGVGDGTDTALLYTIIFEWLSVAEEGGRRAIWAEEHSEWVEVFDMGVMRLASEALQPLIDTLLHESKQQRKVIRRKRSGNNNIGESGDVPDQTATSIETGDTSSHAIADTTTTSTTPPPVEEVVDAVEGAEAPIEEDDEVEGPIEGGDVKVGNDEAVGDDDTMVPPHVDDDPREGGISPDIEAHIRDVGLSVIGSP